MYNKLNSYKKISVSCCIVHKIIKLLITLKDDTAKKNRGKLEDSTRGERLLCMYLIEKLVF